MTCPTHLELRQWVLGDVSVPRIEGISDHLSDCASCSRFIETLDNASDDLILAARSQIGDANVSESFRQMMQAVGPLVDRTEELNRVLEEGRIRDYELIESIGRGGMGTVYRAVHTRLKKEVAVKLLLPRRANSLSAIEHFQQEMAAVGQLDHPNIVRALDAGEHEGVPYLVMELVDGVDAQALVEQHGPLGPADACEIVRQASLGLHYAHEQQIVHRDVKPSNLMLTTTKVLLMDLGLARLNRPHDNESNGAVMGSYGYMAPEQFEDSDASSESDIYGLGATLYFLLTGSAPHAGLKSNSISSMIAHRANAQIIPVSSIRSDVPTRLVSLIERLLSYEPNLRPNTASEVAKLLVTHTRGAKLDNLLPTSIRSSLNTDRTPMLRSKRAYATIGVIALVVVLGFMLKPKPDAMTASPGIVARQSVKQIEYQICVTKDGRDSVLYVCPGDKISVTAQSEDESSSQVAAWDLLELRLNHPQEFAIYNEFWPLFEGINAPLYPHDGKKNPSGITSLNILKRFENDRIEVEFRDNRQAIRVLENSDGSYLVQRSEGNGHEAEFHISNLAQLKTDFPNLLQSRTQ